MRGAMDDDGRCLYDDAYGERPHFSLLIEVVSNELGVFIQTTRDGRVSKDSADIAADVSLATPAMMSVMLGMSSEVPDA